MIELVRSCNHLKGRPENLQVCLVYPGELRSGLSSLSIQNLYSLLNSINGVSCDLLFSDTGRSLFLRRKISEFDIVAFSITYENHLFDAVRILLSGGIEPLREERGSGEPLIIAGGIGAFYNPAPLLPIFDAVYLGEAEGRVEEVFSAIPRGKESQLRYLDRFDNVVVSRGYRFRYSGSLVEEIEGKRKRIFKSELFPRYPSHSCFISDETEFSNMYLIELNRGCFQMCKFCVAAFMGLPYREKEIDVVKKELSDARSYTDRVGLIGAGVTDYSEMEELYRTLRGLGLKASFSSLKASSRSDYVLKILRMSGQKTATLAPETGSQELRFRINKRVRDEDYLSFAEELFRSGVENLKLYFLIGLPGEDEEDIRSTAGMIESFREVALRFWRERGRAGRIVASVNPLIPKPFTPFQWFGMPGKGEIERKVKLLRRLVGRLPNVSISVEGIKSSILQAVISRGDTRVGTAVAISVKRGESFRKSLKEMGLKLDELYTRERALDEVLPWDFVESGIDRNLLWHQYRGS